ncbi:MAG: M28 family peptidase [Phycisphaerales bacterium]|nr:M28 family peptidase [Phycisphaerales bacterium]
MTTRRLAVLVMLSLSSASAAVAQESTASKTVPTAIEVIKKTITAEQLRTEVTELASDEMGGRFFRSPFAEKAALWISARLESAGLTPTRTAIDSNPETGPNLVASMPAPTSGATPGYILVTAHYDHLRPRRSGEDKIHNGADDNASGVAGLLGVARALRACAGSEHEARCMVLFVAFNGEEAGMVGSRAFVKNPPVPLHEIRGVFNMDMISRGKPREIFLDAGPVGASVIATLKKANEQVGLSLRVDEHPEWLNRSDQGPFLQKKVPAVLFSVEDHEDYHRVSDEVAKIDAPLAAAVAQLVALAVIEMSREPFTPREAPTEVRPASVPAPSVAPPQGASSGILRPWGSDASR